MTGLLARRLDAPTVAERPQGARACEGGQARQRDLFPLPVPTSAKVALNSSTASSERCIRRRRLRRQHVDNLVSEAVTSLNEIYGFYGDAGATVGSTTSAQRLALENIRDAVVRFGAPPPDLSGPGALRELRVETTYGG